MRSLWITLFAALTALSDPVSAKIAVVPPKELADYICVENAVAANQIAKVTTFSSLRDFYLGRLTAMDEDRDWAFDTMWTSVTKENPHISMESLKACVERYSRYTSRSEPYAGP